LASSNFCRSTVGRKPEAARPARTDAVTGRPGDPDATLVRRAGRRRRP
jgi:hypothetical protein